jgi:hypothetical protein
MVSIPNSAGQRKSVFCGARYCKKPAFSLEAFRLSMIICKKRDIRDAISNCKDSIRRKALAA